MPGKGGLEGMIKGAKKQMIVIRTGDSRYFDEAYFVLRRNVNEKDAHHDILREANRILADRTDLRLRERPHRRRWLFFAVGILCGAAAALVLAFFLF